MVGKCKARAVNVSSTILAKRPAWSAVYEGYPKNQSATDDESAPLVFANLLGSNYDKSTFGNACATRVSLGLINGGMRVKASYRIQNRQHPFYNKGFITSALGLKDWLSLPSIWGEADTIICNPKTIDEVANQINRGRIKNGIYIIIGGFTLPTTGHATLWIGNKQNVIGGHHYILENSGHEQKVYFWELK